jgi:hypothetical protein
MTETLAEATWGNSSFSKALPGLQLAVDSTSLGEFKICPRRYYYSIVLGLQPRRRSDHLTFGILVHEGCEKYDNLRASGESHEDALAEVIRLALCATWDRALQRPWASDIPAKNRLTLVRTLIWYLDQFGEHDPLETVILANGRPAVELSFTLNTGWTSTWTGEPLLLCGHLDKIARMDGVEYIVDRKTTGHALDSQFFAQFTPDNQFSLYATAARVVFHHPVQSLIVDGMQVLVSGTRFARGPVPRPEAVCSEWLAGTSYWLDQMELCASAESWPMNDKSCGLYGGCGFREVCSKSPEARAPWLERGFTKRTWDPLQRRGDV